MKRRLSRRRFLGNAALLGAGGLAATIVPSSVLGAGDRPSPSNRITMGCIGVGGEGTKNLMAFLGQPDAQVVAVCEVDPARVKQARRAGQPSGTRTTTAASRVDFREIIARHGHRRRR